MFKLYSKRSEYIIRLLASLRPEDVKGVIQLPELCARAKVSESYARKGFQLLSGADLVKATNGPGGGYQLQRDPKDITLYEIITAVDGEDYYHHCVLGLPKCKDETACAFHAHWKPVKKELIDTLQKITLKSLVKNR